MSVYVYDRWLLADGWEEARRAAKAAGVPTNRIRRAGTAGWCYEITPAEYEWAVTAGALEVNLRRVQQLVAGRIPTDQIGRVPAPERDAAGRHRSWSPTARQHWWEQREDHVRRCFWCGLATNSRKVERQMLAPGASVTPVIWFTEWTWPRPALPGRHDGNDLHDEPVPRCPGPSERPRRTD